MRQLFAVMILMLSSFFAFATHNRAGEITYKHISGNLFEFTLITYTYRPSEANATRDYLTMQWGDGTESEIKRIQINYLPDEIQKNTYIGKHEFPGPGVYAVVMSDPNRNEGIVNIQNSVNIVFTVKTILKIDGDLGYNNTPELLNPPIDKAAVGQRFVYNPSAFDIDGDSISYRLAVCLGANGEEIPSFDMPAASKEIYMNAVTGDFVWDAPMQIGEYNVAIEIEEWRNGVKMSSIIRDMQIHVTESDNQPPVIDPIADYCITAGNFLQFTVTAHDPDNDSILLSAYGGPFEIRPDSAYFVVSEAQQPPASGIFNWQTTCNHIRKLPYTALFRAEDVNPDVHLTAYDESNIQVVAAAPQNLQISPSSNTLALSWDNYYCTNALGMKIYRKKSSYAFSPDNCKTGIPADGNYQLIYTTDDISINNFTDTGDGTGLTQGYTYCYRIVAYFEDGSESYVSGEVCAELIKDSPVFIKTSVLQTSETEGQVQIEWLKPEEFNTGTYPGPYKYVLESSPDLEGGDFTKIAEISGIDNTSYTDINVNTKSPVTYRLTMFSTDGATDYRVGEPVYSRAVFLTSDVGDRKVLLHINDRAPWTNYEYTIYRASADQDCNISSVFDSVGTCTTTDYLDTGLENGNHYIYKVRSTGQYDLAYLPKPLVNFSQELCVVPEDTVPPCKVYLNLSSNCDLFQNNLNWIIADSCKSDVAKYLIYYRPTLEGDFELIGETVDTFYMHEPDGSLAGCYVVSAQDSVGNFYEPEDIIVSCIDECYYYRLPNVFTPNNDGNNDLFVPYPYGFVEKIDLKIYNRWGNLVFETDNPDINWNGTDQVTGKALSNGVYYYLCDVYEQRLTGVEIRHINGFVTILGSDNRNATD